MRAYLQNDDNGGMIDMANVAQVDGQHYTAIGTPINPTGDTITLTGWPDQVAEEYATDLGAKFYIPVKK